jgi:hypothetical protein
VRKALQLLQRDVGCFGREAPQLLSEAQILRSSRKRSNGADDWMARMR